MAMSLQIGMLHTRRVSLFFNSALFLRELGVLRQGRQDAGEFQFTEFWEERMS